MTQTTASDKIVLDVGPVEQMLMPDQAKGATSGEVMVPMPGMPMPQMVMTDQGHPVNHHLEVHLFNKTTGAVIKDPVPTITLTGPMGMSHKLGSVMAMYGVTAGPSDWHFGNNVYLPDGIYTITVQVGNEQAVFTDVMVSAGGMTAPMTMPSTMPKSGGAPIALAVLGGTGLIGVGMACRRWRLGDRR